MSDLKPKEPLIAVMLSFIFGGLGQIYAGRIIRGILFFCIPFIIVIPGFLYYAVNPNSRINIYLLGCAFIILFAYGIFVIIDAYRCAKAYNVKNNLIRSITAGKRVLIILGILFIMFIFNPSDIIAWPLARYIKSNVMEAYKIPSGTMTPALMVGDRIFADKGIYKKTEPKRGDVVIFTSPFDPKINFVKRIAGLPGETIEIKDGKVIMNGIAITEPEAFKRIYYYNRGDYAKVGQPVKIPSDSYFVLGDNSANSKDSRYFGLIPRKSLRGKAYKIIYPFDRSGPIK